MESVESPLLSGIARPRLAAIKESRQDTSLVDAHLGPFAQQVCRKFEELRQGTSYVIYERLVFNQRNQKEGERIENFVSELKRLSLTCKFGDLRDSLIRDRIVGGVLSDEL